MITQTQPQEEYVEQSTTAGLTSSTIGLVLSVLACLVALWSSLMFDAEKVDGYGLISAVPPLYWFAVAVAVVGAGFLLWSASEVASRHVAMVPFTWLVLLHTVPHLARRHPRGSEVWRNLGLIDLAGVGPEDSVDGALAWPGFYATFLAPLNELDPGATDLILRLWPSVITGGVAVLVAALARRSYPTLPAVGSLSALIYVLLAWPGHDHFSPRSVGVLMFVALLVVVESGPLRSRSAWSASIPLLPRFSVSGGDRPDSESAVVFAAMILVALGAVTTHPVAPFYMITALAVLGLYGRRVAWRLLLLTAAVTILWLLLAAQDQLDGSLTGFASLFGAPTSSPGSGEATNLSAEAGLVANARLYIGLAAVAGAVLVGLAMSREANRHLRPTVPLVPLGLAVAAGLALGGLDGPSLVEVYTFALPVAAVLIGRILAGLRPQTMPIVTMLAAIGLTPLLLLARYGGESYERASTADRAAIESGYAQANADTLFVADNRFVAWGDHDRAGNGFLIEPVVSDEAWLESIKTSAETDGHSRIVVVLTESQQAWRVHASGDSATSLNDFAAWLASRPDTALLYNEGAAWAIEVQP